MVEMKESGLYWIGEIPSSWIRGRIKNVCSIIGSGTTPTSNISEFYDNGDINWIQSGDIYGKKKIESVSVRITEKALFSSNSLKMYHAPYIVIAMYGGSVGNTAISYIDACTNQACCCLKPNNDVDFTFLYYWILLCKEDFLLKAEGGGQPNISQDKIKNQWIYLPQIEEEKRIAQFLDSKCEEIDALSKEVQAEIDTLEKYKYSIIVEKVTKGLNPDVRMKDSSIGWIPKVPSHWNVSKFKYHLKRQTIKNHGDATVLSLYREFGVIPKDSREDNHNVTSEDTSKYLYVKKGDFVINKMKAWQGSVAVSNYNGIVSPAYYVYEFSDESIYKDYFHYLMRNRMYAIEFRRLSGGIREGQWDLSAVSLENIWILIPPYNEQVAIAEYLNKTTKEIEEIINRKKEQLAVLKEYKKTIIYEYVTGKKVHA